MPENGAAVIDPEVLWNCTSCGACVQQCPVDIEHVDHIIDMRRYAVLVESNFPAELNGLFKGLENKGNPWNMSPNARLDWAKGLDFEVKVVGDSIESLDEVDWLFWVGCAGAYEDRAKKTTRAVAELLDMAGVSFGVLGNGETCTGDPARRAGNEFVFQGLAQQNVETFKEYKVKKVVSTCAHCFNTLKNEYKEFGVELEVVHHTQLLNRLVREGKLTPVTEGAGAAKRSITYHDPCYIGRHNGVYTPPRELLQILPGAEVKEMPRNSEKSFCCGAGGARMWMEENTGERINVNRTKEAVETGADQIAVGCPFCRVMLSDGLTAQQAKGEAREEVEVLDVAQMLLASVKGEVATKAPKPAAKAARRRGRGAAARPLRRPTGRRTRPRRPSPRPATSTRTEETVTDTEDVGPRPRPPAGRRCSTPRPTSRPGRAARREERAAERRDRARRGGSLFDLGGDEPARRRRPRRPTRARRPREPTPSPSRRAAGEGEAREGGVGPGRRRVALRPGRPRRGEAAKAASAGPASQGRARRRPRPRPGRRRPRRPDRPRRPPRSRTAGRCSTSPHPRPPRRPPEPAEVERDDVAEQDEEAVPQADATEAPGTRSPPRSPRRPARRPRRTTPRARRPARRRRRPARSRRAARCFDIAAPEPAAAPAKPAAAAEPEPESEPAAEAESGETETRLRRDRSPGRVHVRGGDPGGGGATTRSRDQAPTPAPHRDRTGRSIPEGGSLFDIEAPAPPPLRRAHPADTDASRSPSPRPH